MVEAEVVEVVGEEEVKMMESKTSREVGKMTEQWESGVSKHFYGLNKRRRRHLF